METPGTLHGATTVFLRWRFTVTVTTKKCLTRQMPRWDRHLPTDAVAPSTYLLHEH